MNSYFDDLARRLIDALPADKHDTADIRLSILRASITDPTLARLSAHELLTAAATAVVNSRRFLAYWSLTS